MHYLTFNLKHFLILRLKHTGRFVLCSWKAPSLVSSDKTTTISVSLSVFYILSIWTSLFCLSFSVFCLFFLYFFFIFVLSCQTKQPTKPSAALLAAKKKAKQRNMIKKPNDIVRDIYHNVSVLLYENVCLCLGEKLLSTVWNCWVERKIEPSASHKPHACKHICLVLV